MALDNVDSFIKWVNNRVHQTHLYVAEGGIAKARQNNTYMDRTANLRNSLGYTVLTPVSSQSDFVGEGESYARDLLEGSFCSVMVAGMPYAAAVEAKGYDVLSNATNAARNDFKKLIQKSLKV